VYRGVSAQAAGVEPGRYRRALGAHAAGVVVVTASGPSGPLGLTVSSFTSVGIDPPLVSFYIADSSQTWPQLRQCDAFAVNLLAQDQQAVAGRFARRDADRFGPETAWSPGPLGIPLLDGTAGYVLCRRHAVVEVGDHWLVVGRVVGESVEEGRSPLVRHRGRYTRLDEG
jgi:flavin reductase (DIM6/NTAB) family NADH-FMN oxidoreductase RutF